MAAASSHAAGVQQSQLSKLASPPAAPDTLEDFQSILIPCGAFGLFGIVTLVLGIASLDAVCIKWGCIFLLPLILIYRIVRNISVAEKQYYLDFDQWEKSRMCTRCGHFYHLPEPGCDSVTSANIINSPDIGMDSSTMLDIPPTQENALSLFTELRSTNKSDGYALHVLANCTLEKYYAEDMLKALLSTDIQVSSADFLEAFELQVQSDNTPNAILELLLNKCPKVDGDSTYWSSRLCDAIRHDNLGCVTLLLDKGVNLNYPDSMGHTPLWTAVFFNKFDAVKLLLEKGANPNFQKGPDDWPILIWAIRKCELPIIELLVESGANLYIDRKQHMCSTADGYARSEKKDSIAAYIKKERLKQKLQQA